MPRKETVGDYMTNMRAATAQIDPTTGLPRLPEGESFYVAPHNVERWLKSTGEPVFYGSQYSALYTPSLYIIRREEVPVIVFGIRLYTYYRVTKIADSSFFGGSAFSFNVIKHVENLTKPIILSTAKELAAKRWRTLYEAEKARMDREAGIGQNFLGHYPPKHIDD